jgi:glycosyltransferase involved in cell wall biosynthesis
MPTWNAETFLAEAIESILSQSFTNFELIVLDGASTDNTLRILANYDDRRIRVVQAPEKGIVSALNFGIQEARAPWIARHDADDISSRNRFETQWYALKNHAGAVFSHTDVEFIGEGKESMRYARLPRSRALLALRLCWQCPIVHGTVMFSKERAIAVGGYRTKQAEDFDLWGRLIDDGPCIGIPEKLLKFRLHAVSASNRHKELMVTIAKEIALNHSRRFMNLSTQEAERANGILVNEQTRKVFEWWWFLTHCIPRMRWKSAEMFVWLALQTFKMLRR